MRSRRTVKGALAAAVAVLMAASLAAAPKAEAQRTFWPVRPSKVIYLTFDDGPSSYTAPIMQQLRRYNAKATFFMLGRNAASNRSLVNSVRFGGHAIGNHSYTHPNFTQITPAEIVNEMQRTDQVIGRTRCMRPPYQAADETVRRVVAEQRKAISFADIDSNDWAEPGVDTIVSTVMSQARDGGVVLFHDGGGNRRQTVDALTAILGRLSSDGYRFERVPECR